MDPQQRYNKMKKELDAKYANNYSSTTSVEVVDENVQNNRQVDLNEYHNEKEY